MKKEIIKLTETDLHNIVKETVNKVLKEDTISQYWMCEFEGKDGSTIWKMIYAKSHPGAFQHTFEMGARIGMEPKYETLRNATKDEVREFKRNIKNRLKSKNEVIK